MKKYFILISGLITFYNTSAQEKGLIVIGQIDNVYSEILHEQRELWIYVRTSSKIPTNAKYPVIFLLDGDAYFIIYQG